MDARNVLTLMELIDRAKVPPPNDEPISVRNQAIIAKAEAEIDAEIAPTA